MTDAAFAVGGPEIGVGQLHLSPTSLICAYSPSPCVPSVQQFESQALEGNSRVRC